MPHSQELSNNPILSRINPIPRIDTYFFNIYSDIVFLSKPRPPKGIFPVKIYLLPFWLCDLPILIF